MPTFRTAILDWFRHGLALTVIVSHCIPALTGTNNTELLVQVTAGQLSFGTSAVFLFFALSGYLIASSWQRDPHTLRFTVRRLARILPAFFAAMIFGGAVVLPLVSGHWFSDPNVFVGWIYVDNVLPTNPVPGIINSATWTIPYEIFCYVLVLLVGALRLSQQRAILLGLTIAGSVLVGAFMQMDTVPLELLFLTSFWAGSLAHLLPGKTPRWVHLLIVASIPIAVLFHVSILVMPLYACWLMTWLPQVHAPPLRFDWSYGLYVYTFPIQQGLVALLGPHLTPLLLALLSLSISIPICALSWRYIESPALRWAKAYSARTSTPAAPAEAAIIAPS